MQAVASAQARRRALVAVVTGAGGALVVVPDRSRAESRWSSGEPVLAALAAAAGIRDEPSEDPGDVGGDAVTTVLAAVGDAVMELEAVRQRRAIEDAAFDNVWRGQ